MSKWITIGKIVSLWGRGEGFVVYPMTDNLERFSSLEYISIQKKNEEPVRFSVKEVFYRKNMVIVKIGKEEDVIIDKFIGGFLVITEKELPSLQDGEYYVYRLIGLEVYTEKGEFVGKVKNIMSNPVANDVIVVSREKDKELLIPFIKEILVDIDLENNRMVLKKSGIKWNL